MVAVDAANEADVAHALQALTVDAELRRQLQHVCEIWIGGTNPYQVNLAEARAYAGADAVAMLEGDAGGQTYVVCPVALIRCDEATLNRLLLDIDAREWRDPDSARLSFFPATVGQNVGGGMGGGLVTDGVWVHARLREQGLEPPIRAVLLGKRPTIDQASPAQRVSHYAICRRVVRSIDDRLQ